MEEIIELYESFWDSDIIDDLGLDFDELFETGEKESDELLLYTLSGELYPDTEEVRELKELL